MHNNNILLGKLEDILQYICQCNLINGLMSLSNYSLHNVLNKNDET